MPLTLAEAIVLNLHDTFGLLFDFLHLLDQVALVLLVRLLPVEELQGLLEGVASGRVQTQITAELLLFLGVVLLAADFVVEG